MGNAHSIKTAPLSVDFNKLCSVRKIKVEVKSHQTLVVHHFFVFHSSTAPPSGRYVILQEKHRLHDPAEAVWQESSRLLIKQSCRLLEISYI